MKIIILCFLSLLFSCESKNSFNTRLPNTLLNNQVDDGPKPVIQVPTFKISKMKICNREVFDSNISVLNQEHQQLIEGKFIYPVKKIQIDFEEIYKLKNLDFKNCGVLTIEGSGWGDGHNLTLMIEGDDQKQLLVSRNYGIGDRDPQRLKVVFEINNPQLFLSQMLTKGEFYLSSDEGKLKLDLNKTYSLMGDSIFELTVNPKNIPEFKEFCSYGKCGTFISLESLISNNRFQEDKIWVRYGNLVFFGKSKEITRYFKVQKTYSIFNTRKIESSRPISSVLFLKFKADTPMLFSKESRVSTSWTEQECHHSPERDRHEKGRECYDSSRSGNASYIVSEIQGYKKIILDNNNLEKIFPDSKYFLTAFNKCKTSAGEGVLINCENDLSDELLSGKFEFSPDYFKMVDRKISVGLERVLSVEGQGKNNFRLNYPLPSSSEQSIYKDAEIFGLVRVEFLNPIISAGLYQN